MNKPRNTYPRNPSNPVLYPGRNRYDSLGIRWQIFNKLITTHREWWEQVDPDLLEEIISTTLDEAGR
jgi:hypothetical protein